MQRKAISIGVTDYPGKKMDLSGCINDADDWASAFSRFGFDASILANTQATKASIVASIKLTIASLRGPGDVCAIAYSGHGTWVPDMSGDEPDSTDEAICPYDMGIDGHNLLIDDEIQILFDARPKGARIILVTDCCHSGTVFKFAPLTTGHVYQAKYMPPATFVKDPLTVTAVNKLGPSGRPGNNAPLPGVIHFAGCRDVEYSYDASFVGRSNGAFTYFAMKALKAMEELKDSGKTPTYQDLHKAVHHFLPSASFPQSPKFNATKLDRILPLFS
jgi:hypothetical protein